MRYFFLVAWCLCSLFVSGQKDRIEVITRLKELHLVLNDRHALETLVHDSVSYGHSNGWIQTKSDLLRDAITKTLYHSYAEDSIQVVISGNTAYARFVADIDVSLNGNRNKYHLKVLEIWIKEREKWMILARQATR